ncbi:MAG TPA: hypothetical protein VGM18_21035 [Candidatus Sulfotelmatobacter sp.]|jgi:hypothetical protein
MPAPRRLNAVLATLLLTHVACTSQPPPKAAATSNQVVPAENLAPSPAGGSQVVLQKTFKLQGSATFPIEIPAHAVQPHLHGIFESFAGKANGASDDTASISFLILNEEQNADYTNNRSSDSLFVVESSHNQAVNFDLPPALNKPMKYYLVFRDPDGGKGSKTVEASFRVDF